ncbi:hypothetical protein VHUM_03085 [Vanrija humicola]|uniref:WSC domain-containing protein n=1 Tax=Vanrija humicola TaxID=5417 RepID=A0A7D8Z1U9_VANHU|nr:hypothetical protein VHUM_03085 [Vanrija humicola]
MAPVANLLLLALAASSPSASAAPVDGLLSLPRRAVDAVRRYYGDVGGLTKPPPLPNKRAVLPEGWSYAGCVNESWGQRLLSGFSFSSQANDPLVCITNCAKRGFKLAGTEFGDECYCANEFTGTGGGSVVPDSYCKKPCAGDASEVCGDAWYLSFYTFNSTDGGVYCPTASTSAGPTSTTATTATTETTTTTTAATTTTADTTTTTAETTTTTGTTTTDATTTTTTGTTTTDATTTTTTTAATTTTEATATTTTTAAPTTTTASTPPRSNLPHYVWAHHMVGLTYSYTPSDWSGDVSTAKAYGVDGFALNMGNDYWGPAQVDAAYAAAEAQGGFKLFLSFDMTSMSCGSAADATTLVNLVKAHASSPAQALVDGKVLVSTFAGSSCTFGSGGVNGWQTQFVDALKAQGINIFFVPSIFSDPSSFSSYTWMDGELNWNSAWPMGNFDISLASTDAAYLAGLGSKAYMTAISPFFFTHFGPSTYNKNWLYRSDDWLYCTRWEEVIALRGTSTMTEILTWNDFGESSYIGPIKGDLPATSSTWVDGFDHTGLAQLTAYYAAAYKTGAYPAITKDSITLWSRPHPAAATASNDPVGRPTNAGWTSDFLYAVVLATAPATVTLTSGTTSQTFQVGAGLSKLKLASAPGGIGGSVARNGNTVVEYSSGSAFQYTENPVTYNYNYFVGSA